MTKGVPIEADEMVEKKAAMIIWLENSIRGTFSEAFQLCGISRRTGYYWLTEDPQFQVDMDKAREKANASGTDMVETALMKSIKDGNIAGIIFYLKTQARDRGYIEKQIIGGDAANPLQVNHVHDAERTAFAILDAIVDAKTGLRPLALTLDGERPQGTAPPVDQPAMVGVADPSGARLGQDTNGS